MTLAGCASGGDHDAGSLPADACVSAVNAVAAVTPAAGVDVAIAVAADDDIFTPPCVAVEAGEVVTIVVRNVGAHPHNLTLVDGGAVTVDAGQVGFVDATVGDRGVRFVCTLHEGMVGELRVVD